jgi:L-asparagine transporter-like permease
MFRFFRRYRYWLLIGVVAILLLVRVGLVMVFGWGSQISMETAISSEKE